MSNWLPINSNDPTANVAIAVFLVLAAMIIVVVGGAILLPVVIVVAIAKGIHWYANRPTPTDQLYAAAQQRTIAANFPDAEQFMDAYLRRFRDAIRDDPPAYQIYLMMADITDALYKEESLNNPLPPLVAAKTIEEGRYRDQILAHQRKSLDAPRTLEVFNTAVAKASLDFISELPPMAKATADEFGKCD
jgi:hypothetical protein